MHPVITFQQWAHEHHLPDMPAWFARASRKVHDPAFWIMVGMIVFLGLLIITTILTSDQGFILRMPTQPIPQPGAYPW